MISTLKCWLDAVLEFVYPSLCQLCLQQLAGPVQGYVCASCRAGAGGVRFIEPPFCDHCGLPFDGAITSSFRCRNCRGLRFGFSRARAAVHASSAVMEVIHRYKYNQAMWFESFLADLLIARARPDLARQHWDAIVPIPLHPVRQRERGFNQAERLALRLSRASGIPVNDQAVCRVQLTRTQTKLARADRIRNVQMAFRPSTSANLTGQHLVLIDDVLTTGATTGACARALRLAGARQVAVWTVARGV